ncbi:beta-1,3-galactosyltransferase 1-like [Ornithodoros turicata]|uniref:beta-1,3-galactosyltransferase 1-like n=1 Tax=Ornithodoros turicata TaxID=34597 RepID=UPI003138D241
MLPPTKRVHVDSKYCWSAILFMATAFYVWRITLRHPTVLHIASPLLSSNLSKSLRFTSPEPAENTTVNPTTVNPHPYTFIINKPNLCETPEEVLLVVVVITAPTHFDRRIAIRSSWGQASLEQGFKVAFFIGLPKDKSVQPLIEAEAAVSKDIIQENFVDTYGNLTLKSIMMVRWITEYCSKVNFVLKIDDDMLLNPRNLWAEVTTSLRNFTMAAWGVLGKGVKTDRNPVSKWYLSHRMYKSEVLPDLLFGPAYMFTGDCAPALYNLSFTVPFFCLEDVYLTGMVAKKAGIRLIHHAGFSNKLSPITQRNGSRQITSHGYKPLDMLASWKRRPFLVAT